MKIKVLLACIAAASSLSALIAETEKSPDYWNVKLPINTFRLAPPPLSHKPEYLDLNRDGKIDAIKTITHSDIPVLWLDDGAGGIKKGDTEVDTANACLLIDRNKDGEYDLIIKWLDEDGDGLADMQLVAEYPLEKTDLVWPYGHYMWVIDAQKDSIFNYIDWNTLKIEAWKHTGLSDFYLGYAGTKSFLKIHTSTDKMDDLRFNWENPFLFYDEDGDKLSEMAIRFMAPRPRVKGNRDAKPNTKEYSQLADKIDWVSIGIDMDNDNRPGNEFDFDMSLCFMGEGFKYTGYVQKIKNLKSMRGLKQADKFFPDKRLRELTELLYPAHDDAWDFIFKKAKWNKFWFVFDEDDDCARWERVEFYKPLDPFKVGTNKGGLDDNVQSDPSGDRGEWDEDGSGGGKLYVSKFDGRIHLYGAEWGAWRIDQDAEFFQGFNRTFQNRNPRRFATVKYSDTNGSGFFDTVEYDLNGDKVFESKVSLKELGLSDECEIIDISNFTYKDFRVLFKKLSDDMWKNAQDALAYAEKLGLNTAWYAKLKNPLSERERYHKGWWLQFYIYRDLEYLFLRNGDKKMLDKLHRAYYSGDWNMLKK